MMLVHNYTYIWAITGIVFVTFISTFRHMVISLFPAKPTLPVCITNGVHRGRIDNKTPCIVAGTQRAELRNTGNAVQFASTQQKQTKSKDQTSISFCIFVYRCLPDDQNVAKLSYCRLPSKNRKLSYKSTTEMLPNFAMQQQEFVLNLPLYSWEMSYAVHHRDEY